MRSWFKIYQTRAVVGNNEIDWFVGTKDEALGAAAKFQTDRDEMLRNPDGTFTTQTPPPGIILLFAKLPNKASFLNSLNDDQILHAEFGQSILQDAIAFFTEKPSRD